MERQNHRITFFSFLLLPLHYHLLLLISVISNSLLTVPIIIFVKFIARSSYEYSRTRYFSDQTITYMKLFFRLPIPSSEGLLRPFLSPFLLPFCLRPFQLSLRCHCTIFSLFFTPPPPLYETFSLMFLLRLEESNQTTSTLR